MEEHVASQALDVGVEYVDVTIPARAEYIAVVRLAAAGVAGRMAFSFDDIEDIKIAVGEACNTAMTAEGRQVLVRFSIGSDRLEIRVAHDSGRAEDPGQNGELGLLLMRCLMDEVQTEPDEALTVTRMSKYLTR